MGHNISKAVGAAGITAVVLNIAAVVALQDQPYAYKPGHLEAWRLSAVANVIPSMVSAWTFTVGLALLAVFSLGLFWLHRGTSAAPGSLFVGALLVALGATLDAAGTPLVTAVVTQLAQEPVAGRALLAVTLHLDASFNMLLGLGLLLLARGLTSHPPWLRGLAAVAGAISIPVAGQGFSNEAAWLLAVAGPLWLTWVLWVSIQLVRKPVA